jgi:hypothetical protein
MRVYPALRNAPATAEARGKRLIPAELSATVPPTQTDRTRDMQAHIDRDKDGGFAVTAYTLETVPLDHDDFAAHRSRTVSVRLAGDAWRVFVDDTPGERAHQDAAAAIVEAGEIVAEAKALVTATAYRTSGLSPARWQVEGFGFRSVSSPGDRIMPRKDFWTSSIDFVEVGQHASPLAAEEALRNLPHLRSDLIRSLERVYGMSGPMPVYYDELPQMRELEAGGLLTLAFAGCAWTASMTEAGLDVLDADPRGLPLALRQIIFDAGATGPLGDSSRTEWNPFLGCGSGSGVGDLLFAI